MSSHPNPDDLNEDAFAARLRREHGRTPVVPPAVDAAILRDARAGFARRRHFRLAARGALAAASAAAAVALALVIPALMKSDGQRGQAQSRPMNTHLLSVAPPPAAPEDVDHNGTVDILDAFVVARLIEVRGQVERTYDVNGDGNVDQADVDQIATVAVDTSASPSRREGGAAMNRPAAQLRIAPACVLCAALVSAWVTGTPARGGGPTGPAAYPSLAMIDVFIDTHGKPLAAYQIELRATSGDVELAGIEGGDHGAYARTPYYDPNARPNNRVVIAAFNTAGADALPSARTRVARLTVRTGDGGKPLSFEAKLRVAASPDGRPLAGATLTVSEAATPDKK